MFPQSDLKSGQSGHSSAALQANSNVFYPPMSSQTGQPSHYSQIPPDIFQQLQQQTTYIQSLHQELGRRDELVFDLRSTVAVMEAESKFAVDKEVRKLSSELKFKVLLLVFEEYKEI
jgi:hypothetical protein